MAHTQHSHNCMQPSYSVPDRRATEVHAVCVVVRLAPRPLLSRSCLHCRSGRSAVLVATDVAARGLDISGVRAVVNYDFPMEFENYIHRIGRTGRAGASGDSLALLTANEARAAAQLVKVLREVGQEVPEDVMQLARGADAGGRGGSSRYGGGGGRGGGYGRGGGGGRGRGGGRGGDRYGGGSGHGGSGGRRGGSDWREWDDGRGGGRGGDRGSRREGGW